MKLLVALVFVIVSAEMSIPAESRTWRVNTYGTGDAPTLYAAMDSAAAWDTVLVEAGTYELESALSVPRGVHLVGESGSAHTVIWRDAYSAFGTISLNGALMSGIHVRGNTLPVLRVHGAAVYYCIIESLGSELISGEPSEFRNCLFVEGYIGVIGNYVACIFMSDIAYPAIGSTFFVNNVLGEVDPGVDILPSNLNFSLDPLFCGIPGSGNYFLQSGSPCLAENNPYGIPTLVGPLGMGCGTVRIEERTWGGVKALFR